MKVNLLQYTHQENIKKIKYILCEMKINLRVPRRSICITNIIFSVSVRTNIFLYN